MLSSARLNFLDEYEKLNEDQKGQHITAMLSASNKPDALQYEYFEHEDSIIELVKLLKYKGNAELIKDKPEAAPSKRIIKLIPEYECNKVSVGAAIAGMIGIEWLKSGCKHFSDWLDNIKDL